MLGNTGECPEGHLWNDVRRVIDSIDPSDPSGKRDRACAMPPPRECGSRIDPKRSAERRSSLGLADSESPLFMISRVETPVLLPFDLFNGISNRLRLVRHCWQAAISGHTLGKSKRCHGIIAKCIQAKRTR